MLPAMVLNATGSATSGNVRIAALLRGLDHIGAHALEIDPRHLGVPGDHRLQPRGAHLHRLLHQVIEPGMLERREQEMQVARPRLLAHALADQRGQRPLAGAGEPRLPFAVAAVEQQQGIAALEPQHVEQVIGLVAVERNLAAAGQRGIEVDAGGAEIVGWHGAFVAIWLDSRAG